MAYGIEEYDPFAAFAPPGASASPRWRPDRPDTSNTVPTNPGQWYTLDDGRQVSEEEFSQMAPGTVARQSSRLVDGGTRTADATATNAFAGYRDAQGGGFGGDTAPTDSQAIVNRLGRTHSGVADYQAAFASSDPAVRQAAMRNLGQYLGGAREQVGSKPQQFIDFARSLSPDIREAIFSTMTGPNSGFDGEGQAFAGRRGYEKVYDNSLRAVLGLGGVDQQYVSPSAFEDGSDDWQRVMDAIGREERRKAANRPPDPAQGDIDAMKAAFWENGQAPDDWTDRVERVRNSYRPVQGATGSGRSFGTGWQNPYAGMRPVVGAGSAAWGSPRLNTVQAGGVARKGAY